MRPKRGRFLRREQGGRDSCCLIRACCLGLVVLSNYAGCDRAEIPVSTNTSGTLVIGGPGTRDGRFYEPRALAASPSGKLFVIDKSGRVQRFSASGDFEIASDMRASMPRRKLRSGSRGDDHVMPTLSFWQTGRTDQCCHSVCRATNSGILAT